MTTCTVEGLTDLLGRAGLETPVPHFPGSDVLHNPQEIFKAYLAQALQRAVDCDKLVAYDAIQPPNMTGMGDLVIVSPRLRLNGIAPRDLVIDLAEKLPSKPPFAAPFVDGIHLRVMSAVGTLARVVPPYVLHRRASYGYNDAVGHVDATTPNGPKKKLIVEFSSPNMATEFGLRHLRSTLIGAFVANLYQGMGWEVVRMNYLGDIGKPTGLLLAGWKRFGKDEDFANDPIGHLLEVNGKIKEEFKPEQEASKALKNDNKDVAEVESKGLYAERDELSQRLEKGDEDITALWKPFRDATIEKQAAAHARLGITFDERSGESQVSAESIAEVEAVLKEKGVIELQDDGGWILDFAKHNAKGLAWAAVRYRDGTSGYLLRDVAAVLDRSKAHSFDKMIYVVEAKQDTHFQRIHKALELMDRADLSEKLQHINYGEITGQSEDFAECKTLDDYMNKASDLAKQALVDEGDERVFLNQEDETLNRLGMSAMIALDLAHKRTGSYALDVKKIFSFGLDTGITFQNCYARLTSILADHPAAAEVDFASLDHTVLEAGNYSDILRTMAQFPDSVAAAYKATEPSHIIGYITRLVEVIEMGLQDDDEEDWEGKEEAVRVRMVMYEAARQVLENAMRLVGLQPCGA